ncbi:MAG: hypothetical protein A07HB70_01790 [uncultured archaeon A07HB70]|nr:MAG: hypothetical protein A07HB70_01790 [uncultured archaeon A07HB70]
MLMATSTETGDAVTVSAGAVSVSKAFSPDEFPVPTVLFDLESHADEPVELRLTDDVPETVTMDAVGFHPEYDADAWTAYRDRRVQFEVTLDPGESVRTVYGVRVDDADPAAFAGEPRVELLGDDGDSPDAIDEEDALDRETTQEVREALAAEENAASPADVEAALNGGVEAGSGDSGGLALDGDGESQITLDGGDGGGGIDLDDVGAARESPSLDPTGGPTTDDRRETDDRSLTAAVAAEIGAGDVPDEDVDALRDALGVETPPTAAEVAAELEGDLGGEPTVPTAAEVAAELEGDLGGEPTVPTSVEVRLDRLQSTVADLSAYTDALENFLDEEGDGQQAIEGFRADVEQLEGEVASLDETMAGVESRLDEMTVTVEEAREAAEDIDPETEAPLDRLEDRVAAIDSRADEFEAEAERLDEFRERLTGALGAAE